MCSHLLKQIMTSCWQRVFCHLGNPTFYPAGVHTLIYHLVIYSRRITSLYTEKSLSVCLPLSVCLFHSVRLNPADLFNHPGALRQDPVKVIHSISALHTPFVLLLSSLLLSVYSSPRSAIVDLTLPRDIKRKTMKTLFLVCMNSVVYILYLSVT